MGRFVQLPDFLDWIRIEDDSLQSVVMEFRRRAEQLLQAANELAGDQVPELSVFQPLHYVVSFESNDYVSLMLMNCKDKEEALRRGAQFLTRIKAEGQLTQLQSADAA